MVENEIIFLKKSLNKILQMKSLSSKDENIFAKKKQVFTLRRLHESRFFHQLIKSYIHSFLDSFCLLYLFSFCYVCFENMIEASRLLEDFQIFNFKSSAKMIKSNHDLFFIYLSTFGVTLNFG